MPGSKSQRKPCTTSLWLLNDFRIVQSRWEAHRPSQTMVKKDSLPTPSVKVYVCFGDCLPGFLARHVLPLLPVFETAGCSKSLNVKDLKEKKG